MTPHPFEQLLYTRFAGSIGSWDTGLHYDIYAISLLCDSYYSADSDEG